MKKLPIVDEIMDRAFLKFSPDMPLQEAMDVLGSHKLFGACVADGNDKILGILSEKQCLKLYKEAITGNGAGSISKLTVADVMYPEFKTVSRAMGIVEAAQIFLNNQFRRMPVVEGSKLVGQITRRDIVKAIQKFEL